ncbi:MAG: peptide chain release factor 2 [Candidatus Eiseniibacteriota bacterium]
MSEDIKRTLSTLERRILDLGRSFDIAGREKKIAAMEEQSARAGFWDRGDEARKLLRELKLERSWVESHAATVRQLSDAQTLLDLAREEEDSAAEAEAAEEVRRLERDVEALEIKSLFREEADSRSAILSVHPGAGGIDSQDWAEMLFRMYLRWAANRGYETEIVDQQPGEEAGLKSASAIIRGEYAYGYLKVERGVHRLVRISPFDAQKRRHTSFASVDVWAEADEEVEIVIADSELRWDTFRASGAGGQHVNKTDSAVRITHIPTGTVVTCQTERSQHRNRETALKVLKSRLYTLAQEEERRKREAIESEKGEIAWGNQIRSYVFQPYTLVKDHRYGIETGNVQAVIDGDLDLFIDGALLRGLSGGASTDVEAK